MSLRHLSSLIKVNLPTWIVPSVVRGGGGHVYRSKTDTVQEEASENRASERIGKRKKEKRTQKIKGERKDGVYDRSNKTEQVK